MMCLWVKAITLCPYRCKLGGKKISYFSKWNTTKSFLVKEKSMSGQPGPVRSCSCVSRKVKVSNKVFNSDAVVFVESKL